MHQTLERKFHERVADKSLSGMSSIMRVHQHEDVFVYRYADGEPDVVWSSRGDQPDFSSS
jgi:hypothetical protein